MSGDRARQGDALPLRPDPEAFFPRAAGRNTLRVFVGALWARFSALVMATMGSKAHEAAVWLSGCRRSLRRASFRSGSVRRRNHCRRSRPHTLRGINWERPSGCRCGRARSAIRRPPQLGQVARALHEKRTSRAPPNGKSSHRGRAFDARLAALETVAQLNGSTILTPAFDDSNCLQSQAVSG